MSRVHHYLKTETEYYQAVEAGDKKFELRKNDRDFKVGDMLHLEEVVMGVKTGRMLPHMEVKYVLHGGDYGLDPEYAILNW